MLGTCYYPLQCGLCVRRIGPQSAHKALQPALQMFSAALKHEQLRCGYVSAQTKLAAPYLPYDPGLGVQHCVGLALPPGPVGESLPTQKSSSLAASLAQIFEGLSRNGVAHTMVNDWVDLPLAAYDPDRPQAEGCKPEHIRPYHTLLLQDSEETMRKCLGADCSPALFKLMKHADPRLSLQELQQRLDIPLEQIGRLVAHLVCWGKAKVVVTIQRNSMYVLNPRGDLHTSSRLTQDFNKAFPRVALPSILQHFAEPRRLGEKLDVVKSQQERQKLMDWVVWLLKHDVLMALHNYILFLPPGRAQGVWPQRVRTISEEELRAHDSESGDSSRDSVLRDRDGIRSLASLASQGSLHHSVNSLTGMSASSVGSLHSVEEMAEDIRRELSSKKISISQLDPSGSGDLAPDEQGGTESDVEDIEDSQWHRNACEEYVTKLKSAGRGHKLFPRLWEYFDGKHIFEEIMWRAHVSRDEIMAVVKEHKDVLFICLHE